MKRRLVAGLIRLYPSRWRVEFGDELADVLLRRPLRVGGVVNVAVNALRQQLRLQEPWLLMGVPLVLLLVARWIVLLTNATYIATENRSAGAAMGVFFAVGFWTVVRSGEGGGRAAMKLSMLVTVPFLVVGLLALAQIVRVVAGPGGSVSYRLFGPPSYHDAVGRFLSAPLLQIPFAGLMGWCGGLAGRLARRMRRV
jgi:hypothetical protein